LFERFSAFLNHKEKKMFRIFYTVLLAIFFLFTISVFLTPFAGEFATREYKVFNKCHHLSPSICPHPEQTPVVSRSLLERQSNLLRSVCSVFQNSKITFFAFGETLVGATETQGPLPWTDRNDLVILLMDLNKLVHSRPHLEEKGLLLLREKHGYRVCVNNWKRFPFVFVSIMHSVSDDDTMALNPAEFEVEAQEPLRQDTYFSTAFDSDSAEEDTDEEEKQQKPFLETEENENVRSSGMIAICTPLNEINEPTWNGPSSSFQFSQEDIFPLQIQRYANFSLPVPKNAHKVLSKMPSGFVSTVPENDLDVLFKNNNIQSLGKRIKDKCWSFIGYQ
jgi:hypothetical protein